MILSRALVSLGPTTHWTIRDNPRSIDLIPILEGETAMLAADSIRAIVQRAVLAPSSHNTQPWRFLATASAVDLLADRSRALPVNDPFDRELIISCGAALLAMRVAAAAAGLGARLYLLPDGAAGDRLARVELSADPADADLAALGPFIEQRRTCRKAFAAREIAPDVIANVTSSASAEGAALLTLDEARRRASAALVAEGDREQWHDPRWRRELAMWMHPRRDGDGLAVSALAAPIARAVVRSFDLGNGVAAKDQQLLTASPWLTVLGTAGDDARSWLHAGQALQRALLVGCRHGLQASYLNQPIELPNLRARLRSLMGTADHPQLLMRWGHPAHTLPPAPRRPLDAVLEAGSTRAARGCRSS
jgi:nitroreductase